MIGARIAAAISILSIAIGASPARSSDAGDVVPRGARILGMHVLPTEWESFEGAIERARKLGIGSVPIGLDWPALEPTPNALVAADDPGNPLAAANEFFGARDMPVSLTLRPIHGRALRLPPDLADLPLDDPRTVARFATVVVHALSLLPDVEITCLSIGSESDRLLGRKEEAWLQFARFVGGVAERLRADPHIRASRPGLVLGSELGFEAWTDVETREWARAVAADADALMVSYYPLGWSGKVEKPRTVGADLDRLAALYPDRPIYLLQAGYPSGYFSKGVYGGRKSAIKSNEERQARFFEQLFRAWDRHATRIPFVTIHSLTDLDPERATELAERHAGLSIPKSPRYRERLATLGLRTWPKEGENKPALRAVRRAAAVRGWKPAEDRAETAPMGEAAETEEAPTR